MRTCQIGAGAFKPGWLGKGSYPCQACQSDAKSCDGCLGQCKGIPDTPVKASTLCRAWLRCLCTNTRGVGSTAEGGQSIPVLIAGLIPPWVFHHWQHGAMVGQPLCLEHWKEVSEAPERPAQGPERPPEQGRPLHGHSCSLVAAFRPQLAGEGH